MMRVLCSVFCVLRAYACLCVQVFTCVRACALCTCPHVCAVCDACVCVREVGRKMVSCYYRKSQRSVLAESWTHGHAEKQRGNARNIDLYTENFPMI